jgi:hypothetical protein
MEKVSSNSGGVHWLIWSVLGAVVIPGIAIAVIAFWMRSANSANRQATRSPVTPQHDAVRLDLRVTSDANLRGSNTAADVNVQGPTPRLLDVASAAGLQFTYYPDAVPDRFFLPETMGGGAGWFDLDGDGWLDVFLTNGCRLPVRMIDRAHVQRLFRQTAPGQFTEIAELAGVALTRYGQGCTAGDLDNDGFSDIVVTAYGNVTLLSNNGDGTMNPDDLNLRITDPGWSTSAALGDLNRDGCLDLYVAHYAIMSLDEVPICTYDTPQGKARGYCGPASYVAETHALLMNREDGTFERLDLSGDAAPRAPGKGLAVVIGDLDGDDWSDIYVANDMDANYLFHNLGNGSGELPRLEEVAMTAGAALSIDGVPEAGMGVACADFSGEQRLDLFITHYYLQKNTFYQNHGSLLFSDRSVATGLAAPSLPYLGFGTVPIDYDLDGWQDLFVANGHVLGKAIQPYGMRAQVFRNTGKAKFVEVSNRAGAYFYDERVSRGAALGDYDNDGDEDIVVVHLDDRPVTLLRNDSDRTGQPLGIELTGRQSPRSGLGTRVFVHANGDTRMRTAIGGGSYLSSHDLRILVGVAKASSSVSVEVHWPAGEIETWSDLKPGRYWRLIEGTANQPPPAQLIPRR